MTERRHKTTTGRLQTNTKRHKINPEPQNYLRETQKDISPETQNCLKLKQYDLKETQNCLKLMQQIHSVVEEKVRLSKLLRSVKVLQHTL